MEFLLVRFRSPVFDAILVLRILVFSLGTASEVSGVYLKLNVCDLSVVASLWHRLAFQPTVKAALSSGFGIEYRQ